MVAHPQSGPSVYKTFGRSYDRIYRRSGIRPDGLRFIKRLVVPTIEFTAGAASGLTACGLM
ncbi:MAG TPA: hypothetical protein VMX95_05805 [Thermodesulfobacteriota bacterium]|nr:hypothetical protein [Thermodesulfobacteriota bacterium]